MPRVCGPVTVIPQDAGTDFKHFVRVAALNDEYFLSLPAGEQNYLNSPEGTRNESRVLAQPPHVPPMIKRVKYCRQRL